MFFLGKLKFNIIHLSLHDFSETNFTLHNCRFISLLSSNCKSFYFFTVCSVRLWNSMNHDVTFACNFCTFRRLLHDVNFVPYLRGRVRRFFSSLHASFVPAFACAFVVT